MLKIKDEIINKKLIKFISKAYLGNLQNPDCIRVHFTDDTTITISFNSEKERDEEFDRIMKNEE